MEVTRGQFWIKIAFFRQTKGKKLRKLSFFKCCANLKTIFQCKSKIFRNILGFSTFVNANDLKTTIGSVSIILTPMNDAIKEINSKLSPRVAELYKLTEILFDTSEFI